MIRAELTTHNPEGYMKRRDFLTTALTVTAATTFPEGNGFAADFPAVATKGDKISLSEKAVLDFQKNIRGQVILPSSAEFEAARKIWNGSFDRRPSLIAKCADVGDVVSAVQFARSNNILLAVRGGGHSYSGQSATDGGMVIDLSMMQRAEVDPGSKTCRLQGGALLGNLDRAGAEHGLATTAGFVSHTGVGGLATGGGHGRLMNKFGLTVDNVRGVEIVTADGMARKANASENQDLHWAVRGGGGNFGIVTDFEFQLHKMDPMITSFSFTYPIDVALDVMKFYFEWDAGSPEEAATSVGLRRPSQGEPSVSIGGSFIGTPAEAEIALAKVMKYGKPINSRIAATNYVSVQAAADKIYAHGRNYYSKSGFFNKVDPMLPVAMLDYFMKNPMPNGGISAASRTRDGAVRRVPENATAYAHRDALYEISVSCAWDDPAESQKWLKYSRDYWAQVAPFATGFYINQTTDEGSDAIRKNYRGNYDRLVEIKTKYDPTNFFHLNANIPPKKKA